MMRIVFDDGTVESYGDDDAARYDFELLAFAGESCSLVTAQGVTVAAAFEKRVAWVRESEVAAAVHWMAPAEPRKPSAAWVIMGLLVVAIFASMIGQAVGAVG